MSLNPEKGDLQPIFLPKISNSCSEYKKCNKGQLSIANQFSHIMLIQFGSFNLLLGGIKSKVPA